MEGWLSPAADWASRRNRARKVGSRARSVRSILIATGATEPGVVAEVHLGHAAAAEELADLVAAAEDLRWWAHFFLPPPWPLPLV